jgi:hypothetical protein
VDVQRHLFAAGFPSPEPLAGPSRFDRRLATAEAYVPADLSSAGPAAGPSAGLLADLIEKSPPASRFPALRSPPPWVGWDHPGAGTWPAADDLDVDLNIGDGPAWLDGLAARLRLMLRRDDGVEVIGHVDWEAHNLGWESDRPVVVYDWDSLAIRSEPAVAGAAAAVFCSTTGEQVAATVDESEAFLDAYQERRRVMWSKGTLRLARAAGLWVLLFNAKKETVGGGTGYLRHLELEVDKWLRQAGLP